MDEENATSREFQESIQKSIQETPRGTFWAFLLAVLFAQAGLFAVSLGMMLIGFRDQWMVGGALFSGGVLALVITVIIYRWHRALTEP